MALEKKVASSVNSHVDAKYHRVVEITRHFGNELNQTNVVIHGFASKEHSKELGAQPLDVHVEYWPNEELPEKLDRAAAYKRLAGGERYSGAKSV